MASSGTFTSSRYGDSYGPWLQLSWSIIDTDIANNRTQIRLILGLHSDRSLFFSSDKAGVLEGTSFTHATGFSGTGSKTLKTKDMWVSHASDGTGSIALNATFDLDINWSGNSIGRMSVSGTAYLDTIPRASDFTAFTLSNPVLNYNENTMINYTLDRKSSSFSHDMELRYGSKVIASWNTTATGSLSRTLLVAEVNTILRAMSNNVSGSLRLYMQTKSGSTPIGPEKYIIENISINTAVRPTASAITSYIYGNGRDKTIGQYVRLISRITASFTASAGYGASIRASNITVKRQSDGANSQLITGTSGTTSKPFTVSGTFIIEGYVEDTRGRTERVSSTFVVQAYNPPTISRFLANRKPSPTTTVDVSLKTTWSPLTTSNPTNILLVGIDNAGVQTTLYTLNASTTGSLDTIRNIVNQSDTESYVYLLTVTDSFGNSASADAMVGTAFMEFTIRQGMGIGVGKIHERGALDVNGDVYMVGRMRVGNYNLITEDLANPRGLELNEGIYLRNGYLDINSYDEAAFGIGRMQSYYAASSKEFRMYGRDGSYGGVPIQLDFPYGGGIKQGAWNYVGNMLNGWTNYSTTAGGFMRLAYRKTTHDTVQVIGVIRYGTGVNICMLPTDFRPQGTLMFPCLTGGSTIGRVDIGVDGYIKYNGTASPSFLSIAIEFPLGFS